jgi:hypothetical protein
LAHEEEEESVEAQENVWKSPKTLPFGIKQHHSLSPSATQIEEEALITRSYRRMYISGYRGKRLFILRSYRRAT